MNFDVEHLGSTRKKMTIEIPADQVQTEINQAVNQLKPVARIKGFRPGKAPAAMLKKLFWPQIEQDVSQKLISSALPDALSQADQTLASQPLVEEATFAEGQPFRFKVVYEIKPKFDLGNYNGIKLTRLKVDVTEDMVDKRLEDLRQAHATIKSIDEDRPVKNGDFAVVSYQAFVGTDPLEGASNPHYQLEVGSGHFHPDFEAALVGLKKEDSREVVVNFAADHYNPKLAGKEVRFEVKLNDIKEKNVPELTEDFVKDLGMDLSSLEDLRVKVRQDIINSQTALAERKLQEQLRDKLISLTSFEVPETMVAEEVDSMLQRTDFNLKRSGLSMEAMGLNEENLRASYRVESEKRVRIALILEKIAKEQGLTVTDAEMDDEIMNMARSMGQSPEVIKEIYSRNNMMDAQRHTILADKTLKFVQANAIIEEVESLAKVEDDPAEASNGE